jgi:hypothetical protein
MPRRTKRKHPYEWELRRFEWRNREMGSVSLMNDDRTEALVWYYSVRQTMHTTEIRRRTLARLQTLKTYEHQDATREDLDVIIEKAMREAKQLLGKARTSKDAARYNKMGRLIKR